MVTEATWVEKAKATYELTKDKAVKIGGAVLVGAGIFASTACGGGSEAAPVGADKVVAAAEGFNAGGNESLVAVHGDCDANGDVYRRGSVAVNDEKGDISDEYMTQLEDNLFFKDGTSDSGSDVDIKPEAYTGELLDQVRQGVMELYEKEGSGPGTVYLLGEKRQDDNDYDGEINKGVYAACVDWS